MADGSGQNDIRGLDIDKLLKGFADEAIIFKRFCTLSSTKSREIRWYQKTAGYLDSTDTSGITASQGDDVAEGATPVSIGQTFTRQTSKTRKYMFDSELITMEDIRDTDVDILATNIRDIVRAVARRVDARIYTVLSTDVGNTTAAAGGGWGAAGSDPIADILRAKKLIREDSYEPNGGHILIRPSEELQLLVYLISQKGSSIPGFSSQKVKDGMVTDGLLNMGVTVSTNVTSDEAMVVTDKRAVTWKSFMPLTHVVIDFPGLGKKVRCWEEGEALVTDPNAACKITGV